MNSIKYNDYVRLINSNYETMIIINNYIKIAHIS